MVVSFCSLVSNILLHGILHSKNFNVVDDCSRLTSLANSVDLSGINHYTSLSKDGRKNIRCHSSQKKAFLPLDSAVYI